MQPDVLHLILCDQVQVDPDNYHRCNIFGVITSIRSSATPPFPVVRPQLLALALWTGGQGTGELMLRVVEANSGHVIFRTRPRRIRFVGDPTAVGGVVFRIQNCGFPAAGLYWIELLFANAVFARQRLFLKAQEPS